MCGLAGIHGKTSNQEEIVSRMLEQIAHRGPDGQGIWTNSNVALGHCRLAINDLSASGQQPMLDLSGDVVVTVNGEIYNYLELKRELRALGYQFVSNSDSEVVIYAWKQWREGCFEKLNGMFAIALYDVKTQELFLARDRVGIKPIYYHKTATGSFIYGSEIKAIKEGIGRPFSLNYEALFQYFTYQNYFSNNTLSEGIYSLEPGTYAVVDRSNTLNLYRYHNNVSPESGIMSINEAVEEYQLILDRAIERHLMSDVPVASYLSAGFDSSTVANRASVIGSPPVSYTGSFTASGWYDEASFARKQAEANGSEHVIVDISAGDLPRVLDKLVFHLDDPMMGMGAFSQYCVAEEVAKRHKVILTGHGGDELFSGYPVFKLAYILDQLPKSKGKLASLGIKISELPHIIFFLLQQVRGNVYNQFFPVLNNPNSLLKAISSKHREHLNGLSADGWTTQFDCHQNKLYDNYLNRYMNGLLVVEDKISMAHSLESRTPFLDNELLEFSQKIPWETKLHNGQLKSIVKLGGIGRLLPELYKQPKRGFPTPLRIWLRGPLSHWFREKIISPESALRKLFDEKWLLATYHGYINSNKKYIRSLDEVQSHRMWQLLCLESWLRSNE